MALKTDAADAVAVRIAFGRRQGGWIEVSSKGPVVRQLLAMAVPESPDWSMARFRQPPLVPSA